MKGGRKVTSVPTTYRPIERVLPRLQGVREVGPGRWTALCPAHNDHSPSLSVREAEDAKALLYCWAGCSAEDVCRAIGLTVADLFPDNGRHIRGKKRPRPSRKEQELRELTARFDRACVNAHRRLSVLYRTIGHIFAVNGLEITPEEVERVKEMPYMELVLDWLLSDDPELKYAGLQVAGRWLA
jgi:hypothetical protein